jgi:hypothetical protein
LAKREMRLAALANLATAGRTNTITSIETPEGIASGLELSGVQYKPSSWFKENPENAIFARLKTQGYMDNLKRDIADTGAILNPLIAMPDGTLIEGHSRISIIRQLETEGRWVETVPVRLILSEISADEIRKRVYLGNLSRFEIDVNTRAVLYREIWPDFAPATATVAVKAASEAVREVAKNTGMKERQAWNERGILKLADQFAISEGKEKAGPEHVARAREEKNSERRQKKSTATVAVNTSTSQTENEKTLKQAAVLIRKQIEKAGNEYGNGVLQTLSVLKTYNIITVENYSNLVETIENKA